MNPQNKALKAKFEEWFLSSFGKSKSGLLQFCDKSGYEDLHVNAMWIGFCGGMGFPQDVERGFLSEVLKKMNPKPKIYVTIKHGDNGNTHGFFTLQKPGKEEISAFFHFEGTEIFPENEFKKYELVLTEEGIK